MDADGDGDGDGDYIFSTECSWSATPVLLSAMYSSSDDAEPETTSLDQSSLKILFLFSLIPVPSPLSFSPMILIVLSLVFACRLLMNGPAVAGLLTIFHACLDIKGTFLDKM